MRQSGCVLRLSIVRKGHILCWGLFCNLYVFRLLFFGFGLDDSIIALLFELGGQFLQFKTALRKANPLEAIYE